MEEGREKAHKGARGRQSEGEVGEGKLVDEAGEGREDSWRAVGSAVLLLYEF